jgi:hypothetical protein
MGIFSKHENSLINACKAVIGLSATDTIYVGIFLGAIACSEFI